MGEHVWTDSVAKKGVHIVSEQGMSIMEVEDIAREGGSLRLTGLLMGEFPTCMYLRVEDFYRLLRLLVSTAFPVFALLSPYYWAKNHWARQAGNMRRILAGITLLVGLILLLYAFFSFAVAMVIVGLVSLINS